MLELSRQLSATATRAEMAEGEAAALHHQLLLQAAGGARGGAADAQDSAAHLEVRRRSCLGVRACLCDE